jgi:hypothetical protein
MAEHGDFLMIDDARQIALDFAMLPELLNLRRSEVATSTEDEKLALLEINRSPQGAPETSRLLRSEGRRCPQMLRRPTAPRAIRTKFLIPIAVAVLPAGCLFFGDSDPLVNVAAVPQVTANTLSAEFSPLQEAEAPLSRSTDITIKSRIEPAVMGSTAESPMEPKVQIAPFWPTVPLDIKPTDNGVEAKPPPQREGQSLAPSQDASPCFPSASAVRRNYSEGRPSWTLRAPGHEGTRCWYPTKQTAPDTRAKETLQTKEELEVSR